jgi:hypothetical protein
MVISAAISLRRKSAFHTVKRSGDRVGNTHSASCSSGLVFKSRPGHQLLWLRFLNFTNSPRKIQGQYAKQATSTSFCNISNSLKSFCNSSPQEPPPYRGEQVCANQCAGELCWRERKLLVGPPMTDRSRVGDRRSVVPGLPGWVGACGDETIHEKFTVTKLWRRPWL